MRDNITAIIIILLASLFIGIFAGCIINTLAPKKITYEVNFTDEEKELIFETLDEIASQRKVR